MIIKRFSLTLEPSLYAYGTTRIKIVLEREGLQELRYEQAIDSSQQGDDESLLEFLMDGMKASLMAEVKRLRNIEREKKKHPLEIIAESLHEIHERQERAERDYLSPLPSRVPDGRTDRT